MGDLAVRTKVIRGHLTTEEKRQFDKLVDSFGMYQQDVLSNILVWWLKQGSKLQAAIGQSEVLGSHKALSKQAQHAAKKRTYEYKIVEENDLLVEGLDKLGKQGWELVCTQETTLNTAWYFKRLI